MKNKLYIMRSQNIIGCYNEQTFKKFIAKSPLNSIICSW